MMEHSAESDVGRTQEQKRLAYVIHEAVCTAYKHEGRNSLCERAAIAVYASEWFDALAADLTADERVAVEAAAWVSRTERERDDVLSGLAALVEKYEQRAANESARFSRAIDVVNDLRAVLATSVTPPVVSDPSPTL